jgi:sulfide dehydrogenase cytochrome subunit
MNKPQTFAMTLPAGTRRTVALWATVVALAATTAATVTARVLAQTAPAPQASAAPHTVAGAPVPAPTMAHSCAACHGTNGQLGDEAFAPLAGMPAAQFVRTMIDFREGRRPATLMGHVARGFSDQDIQGMADFFEVQTPATPATLAAGAPR